LKPILLVERLLVSDNMPSRGLTPQISKIKGIDLIEADSQSTKHEDNEQKIHFNTGSFLEKLSMTQDRSNDLEPMNTHNNRDYLLNTQNITEESYTGSQSNESVTNIFESKHDIGKDSIYTILKAPKHKNKELHNNLNQLNYTANHSERKHLKNVTFYNPSKNEKLLIPQTSRSQIEKYRLNLTERAEK